jgi:hypothetical protein
MGVKQAYGDAHLHRRTTPREQQGEPGRDESYQGHDEGPAEAVDREQTDVGQAVVYMAYFTSARRTRRTPK